MKNSDRLLNLDDLRVELDVAPVNTGVQRSLTTPSGIVTDDIEGLTAIPDEDGRFILQSGVEFASSMYRGQSQEHVPSLPTLGRLKTPEERLVALCRTVAFEDAIGAAPSVRVAERSTFLGRPLRIDRQSLAQHYGLATDMLDFTSNFDVASFFAVCRFDTTAREYRPIGSSEEPGVIYLTRWWALFERAIHHVEFEPVGWQPLPRPEQQRAFGLKLSRGQDLSVVPGVQVARFRQCEEISTRIWNAFDQGRILFPNDSAARLSEEAEVLTVFTRSQVDRAWSRLDAWDTQITTAEFRDAVEARSGIGFTETTVLTWHSLDPDADDEKATNQMSTILNRARYRQAMYLN